MTRIILNYPRLDLAMQSIVAVQKDINEDVAEILSLALNTNEAFAYSRQASSVYPKWLNGLVSGQPQDEGIDEQYQPYTVRMQLQIGKRTEGFDGTLEQQLYVWVPYTLATFRASPRLQSTTLPTVPPGLLEVSCKLVRAPNVAGDTLGAVFDLNMDLYVTNAERDY